MQRQQSTTSLNTMTSFGQNFENQVNTNMNQDNQQFASQDSKGKMPAGSPALSMAEDHEFNEKMAMKDHGQHQLPPRFSTIFDTKLPTTPTKAFESYPQQPARRSGIFIPKAVFWALLIIFLFETAALFAYTVIGLVSNMPSRLVPTTGVRAIVSGCDCNAQPINISPNFYMPQAPQASFTEPSASSTITTSTPSSTPSTSTSSQVVGVNASQLADIMKSVGMIKASSSSLASSLASTHTPTTKTTIVTPPGSTVRSTVLLSVDASGNTVPATPRPTVTSTTIVDAPSSIETRHEPTSVSTKAPDVTGTAGRGKIIPISTKANGEIVVSVSMVPISTAPFMPAITATLKSHRPLANTLTQRPEPELSVISSKDDSKSNDEVSPPSDAPDGCKNVYSNSGKLLGVQCT